VGFAGTGGRAEAQPPVATARARRTVFDRCSIM
jgi:hypothetical protein